MSADGLAEDAPRPGSAAEEATRLFEAVQEWAHRAGSGANEHIATGSAECQLCPVCQLIAALRGTRPDVVAHVAAAAGSVLAAVRAAVDAHEHDWAARKAPDVERIDIG